MNPTERERPSWDEYGMLLAYAAAERSPDPFVQVGAAAFRKDRSVVATGYNGAPSGTELDWTDRDKRRSFVIHAEYNCLKYTYSGEAYYLYVTLSPCFDCLNTACAHGIKEIIYDQTYARDTRAFEYAVRCGITMRQLTLKRNPFQKL